MQKPRSGLGKTIETMKRYLWIPFNAYKHRDVKTSPQSTSKTSTVRRRSRREEAQDDIELQPLTRVAARQEDGNRGEENRMGTEGEFVLERESSWGRSWVNQEGVRVVENDVWWVKVDEGSAQV